jgi:ribonucleoside-diphosphate reductase subunit M1
MFVQKRNGKSERVQFDKIASRIQKLAYGLNMEFVDPAYITQKVIKGVYSGVTTVQLDTLAAETAAYLTTDHPDYSTLAARIAVSNLHKQTEKVFSTVMHNLYTCVDESSGRHAPLLADDVYEIIMQHKEELDSAIIYDRDYSYDYFGFKVCLLHPVALPCLHPSSLRVRTRLCVPAQCGCLSVCFLPLPLSSSVGSVAHCLRGSCRPSSAPTCSRSTASSQSAPSTCLCASLSASTSTTLPVPSKRTTTCRRSFSPTPGVCSYLLLLLMSVLCCGSAVVSGRLCV